MLISHLTELCRYRSLIRHLTVRELKARYRGSLLGFLWTFLNPLFLLTVYALVFKVFFRIQMENYAVFMFVGLLPWIWFSSSIMEGTNSIIAGGSLVTKVLFPLQVLPTVKVFSALLNYLFSLPILFGFLWFYGIPLGGSLLFFPLVLLIQWVFIQALALILSALNVLYRDVQHLVANFLTFWFFLTPILYPLTQVPERFRLLLFLNPQTGFSMAYQDLFFYGRSPSLEQLGLLFIGSVLLWAISIFLFEHHKESFAELV
jgi:ABC-type polysaccharide/polyol phosphate export permease